MALKRGHPVADANALAKIEAASSQHCEDAIEGLETTLGRMREMTKIAEHEIHAVVLACARPKTSDGGDADNEADRALAPWRTARGRLSPVYAVRKTE